MVNAPMSWERESAEERIFPAEIPSTPLFPIDTTKRSPDSIASRRETLRIEAASEANCMRVSSLTDMA